MTDAEQLKPYPDCGTTCDCTADCRKMLEGMLRKIATSASEGVAKNAGIAPQLAFAPILFALQDAVDRPNPSGDADVREKIVSELVEMHKLAIAVANAKRHDGIGSFGAEEDLCQAAVSLRLGNAMLNAAVEIERLALTGNASTDRAGTEVTPEQAVRAHNNLLFQARRGGFRTAQEIVDRLSLVELLSAALLNKDGGAG